MRGAHVPHRITAAGLAQSHTAWFGVGVMAGGQLSHGLPVDVLVLVYAQELARRAQGWSSSLILVADDNAHAAGGDVLAVRRRSIQAQARLAAVIERLGFPADVRLASSLRHDPTIDTPPAPTSLPPYVAHQLLQTEALRRRGIGLKIGWALSGAMLDERYFDDLHAREYESRVGSVYTSGGCTLDVRRPRACPYVCANPNARLLLQPGEDLARKLAHAPVAAARRYGRLLGKLARAHCRLTGSDRYRGPVATLQDLLDDLP